MKKEYTHVLICVGNDGAGLMAARLEVMGIHNIEIQTTTKINEPEPIRITRGPILENIEILKRPFIEKHHARRQQANPSKKTKRSW